MKRQGFTLIELLAVIVVLAIIALIATPIVMNTINKSKKGAAERSVDSYIDAVETTVATKRLDEIILEGEYIIQPDGNICPTSGCGENDKDKVIIEMKGNKPTSGVIVIKDGQVTTDSTMTIGEYDVVYNPISKTYEATKKTTPSVVYGKEVAKLTGLSDEEKAIELQKYIINVGDIVNPNDTSKFTTNPSTLGRNTYLKHVLDNGGKVTKSYACAIFNSQEYCLTNGEYGYAENEVNYIGSTLILKNLRDAKIDGISCDFNVSKSTCEDASLSLNAYTDGYVSAADAGGRCRVNGVGASNCERY